MAASDTYDSLKRTPTITKMPKHLNCHLLFVMATMSRLLVFFGCSRKWRLVVKVDSDAQSTVAGHAAVEMLLLQCWLEKGREQSCNVHSGSAPPADEREPGTPKGLRRELSSSPLGRWWRRRERVRRRRRRRRRRWRRRPWRPGW